MKVQACDSSISTAEPMLPVTPMASSVAATGKRCSSAKISAASAERKNFVIVGVPSCDRLPFRFGQQTAPTILRLMCAGAHGRVAGPRGAHPFGATREDERERDLGDVYLELPSLTNVLFGTARSAGFCGRHPATGMRSSASLPNEFVRQEESCVSRSLSPGHPCPRMSR